jgi:glycosyltransferase involved in cell wall biosynthesis
MAHLYGGLASLGTNVRRVWYAHNMPIPRSAVVRMASWLPADRLYANSEGIRSACLESCCAAEEVQVLRYGLDIDALMRHHPPTGFRRELRIPTNTLVVAMVARFQRWKGQHVIIEAAARVVAEHPGVRFVLVGDTMFGLEAEYRREVMRQVQALNLEEQVIFTGFRPDVSHLINEIDILAQPLVAPEPFPGFVVIEAMLAGKPVVTTSTLDRPCELVEDGHSGLLVAPDDVSALAAAIIRLVSDGALRQRLGDNGRQVVLERYTMDRMIHQLEASYEELAGSYR